MAGFKTRSAPAESLSASGPAQVPIGFDEVVTASGEVVTEQRGTAWLSDDPGCAFPYSPPPSY